MNNFDEDRQELAEACSSISKCVPANPRKHDTASILKTEKDSRKLLEMAVNAYDFEEALWLIDKGAPVDHVTENNKETALTKAAGCGKKSIVRLLLRHGANVNHRNALGRTALMKAAGGGHVEVVKMLLSIKNIPVDIFIKDYKNKTALDWARIARSEDTASELEKAVSSEIFSRRKEIFEKERLSNLEKIIQINEEACIKLRRAVNISDNELIESVVKEFDEYKMTREEFLNIKNEFVSLYGIYGSSFKKTNFSSDISEYFLDIRGIGGSTPLMVSAGSNNPGLVQLLLSRGALVDDVTGTGHTSLTFASSCGHIDVVRTLLRNDASIRFVTKKEKKSALIHAVYNKYALVVMALVDHAVEVAMSSWKQLMKDAQICATDADQVGQIKDWSDFLKEILDIKDRKGRTAFDYAKLTGHKDIIDIISEAYERIRKRQERINNEDKIKIPTPCALGCGFVDRADRIEVHEQWDCENRLLECELGCNKMIPASLLKTHMEDHCKNRIVRCSNLYKGCFVKMRECDREPHELYYCKKRIAHCRLNCGEEMNYDKLATHETDQCRLRVVQCSNKNGPCKAYFKHYMIQHHLQFECENRLILCGVGCGQKVKAKDKKHHEEEICTRPCSLGCGMTIGPPDKRKIHEAHICGHRIVTCQYDCGKNDLQARFRNQHEQNECPRRPLKCTLGCGRSIEAQDMDKHILGENGTCPLRMLPCLYDYIGRRVTVHEMINGEINEIKGFVQKYDEETGEHHIRFGKRIQKGQLSTFHGIKTLDLKCLTCGLLRAKDRDEHIKLKCPKRLLRCPLNCGQVMPENMLEQHVNKRCLKREVECTRGCGAKVRHTKLDEHLNGDCILKKVKCSCGEYLHKSKLEAHGRAECKAARVRCLLGCAKYIQRKDMELHMIKDCPKRDVNCKYGCGVEGLWLENKSKHELEECPLRIVTCPNGCLEEDDKTPKTVIYENLADHLERTCIMRTVTCVCGTQLKFKHLQDHRLTICPKRLRSCGFGCGARVPDDEVEEHESMLCPRRIEDCRLGCGESIRLDFRDKHENEDCPKRAVKCPYKCKDIVRAEGLEDHIKVCPRRLIPCGANSLGCQRTLTSWITGDVFHGKGRLVHCEAHQETALSWAAANGDEELAIAIIGRICASAGKLEDFLDEEDVFATDKANDDCTKPKRGRAQFIMEDEEEDPRSRFADIVGKESKIGHSPMTLACYHGHVNIIKIFAELGGHLNSETSRGRTPITEAVIAGQYEVIEYLLSQRVLVDIPNRFKLNATNLAGRFSNRTLKVLLEETSNFHKSLSSLYSNITSGNVEKIHELLKVGEPHYVNQEFILEEKCCELRKEIASIEEDIYALEDRLQENLPLYEKRTIELEQLESEANETLSSANEIKEKCEKLVKTEVEPTTMRANLELRFLRNNDIQSLYDIVYPPKDMERVMDVVCMLLGIEPNSDGKFWSVARSKLLNDKNVKHRLVRSLTTLPRDRAIEVQALYPDVIGPNRNVRLMDEYTSSSRPNTSSSTNTEEELKSDVVSYPTIVAFHAWAVAVETYHRVKAITDPLKNEESKFRVLYNTQVLRIEAKRDAVLFADRRCKDFADPLKDARIELEEITKELVKTEKKLSCARLLSARTAGGHTALSWACMYGDPDVVTVLLEHGASVEYDDDQVRAALKLIQVIWRKYYAKINRPKWTPALSRQFQLEDITFMMSLKAYTSRFREIRQTSRSPYATALFNGHTECAKILLLAGARIQRRSLVVPVGPPPCPFPSYREAFNSKLKLGQRPVHTLKKGLNVVECAELGLQNMGSKSYKYKVGWDETDEHTEALEYAKGIWNFSEDKRRDAIAKVKSKRIVASEKKKQQQLNDSLAKAVIDEDFNKVEDLIDSGASIDYQIPEGHTALTYAAFIGCHVVNRDGKRVLAVELLLDRQFNLPNIQRENGHKRTALIEASRTGRVDVMEALISRGALINTCTSDGKTPLIHAACKGKWDAVRLLIELGADLDHKDKGGRDAMDWARKMNFIGVMKMLAQIRYNYFGQALASKGKAKRYFMCGWGCGTKLVHDGYIKSKHNSEDDKASEIKESEIVDYTEDLQHHEENTCPKRVVECEFGCGVKQLWAEELDDHQSTICPNRILPCTLKCKDKVMAKDMEYHIKNECIRRLVTCELCKEEIVYRFKETHDNNKCEKRPMQCELQCGEVIPFDRYFEHKKQKCLERLVRCRNDGCESEMKAKFRPVHETIRCPHRPVECRWGCDTGTTFQHKIRHEKEECPLRAVVCPLKCGDSSVQACRLEHHMQYKCKRRFVSCTLKCGKKVPEDDMVSHQMNECLNRIIMCGNEGCTESILAKYQHDHENVQCEFRRVKCGWGCGEIISNSDSQHHRENHCSKRIVQCRMCPKKLPLDERENHETWECRKRVTWCRLGCKATVQADKLNRHEKRECPLRMVTCSLGCGEEMREQDREIHEKKQCLRRPC